MKELGLDRLVSIVFLYFWAKIQCLLSYWAVSAGVSMPCRYSANVLYGARRGVYMLGRNE
jgi:hypothetical protein